LTGFTLVIVGSALPELLAFYGKGYDDGGLLVFVQFVGLLCGVLSMPSLIRLAGRRRTIVAGLLCLSVETLFLLAPPWEATLPILFVAGFGAGLVESSIGALVLLAAADRPASAMSKLEVTFGLGALAMPFLVSLLIAKQAWIYAFPVLGLSSLLVSVAWMVLSFGPLDGPLRQKGNAATRERASGVDTDGLWRPDAEPTAAAAAPAGEKKRAGGGGLYVFLLCALFFSLYGGSEASLIHFLPSVFMEDRHASASVASLVVSVYWTGMVIGRAVTGALADRFGYYPFLLASTGGAAVMLALLAAGGGLQVGFALVFFVGLFMSGMFAIALIFANRQLPGRTDRTTSLLMAVNGLGGALLPYAAGWTMETFPVKATVWLLAGSLGTMLLFLVFARENAFSTLFRRRTAGKR
jgi:FHS family glucose/mannose:H+ symporter-like MFS transporter